MAAGVACRLVTAGDHTRQVAVVSFDGTIVREFRPLGTGILRLRRGLRRLVLLSHTYFFSIMPGSRPSLMTLFDGNVGFSGVETCGTVVTGIGFGVS